MWRNRMVALLNTIREEIPHAVLDPFTQTREGYALRCRDAAAFRTAFAANASAFGDVQLTSPPLRRPPVDVVLRGVDVAFSEEDILADLRFRLPERVKAVRRLHARTEGAIDRSRPIPVVVVTVEGEEAAAQLKGDICLFGVLRVRGGAAHEKQTLPQCRRCFAWGHRAGACRSKRRCIRCGAVDHDRDACPAPADVRRCFACEGEHAVTYAGCPVHAKARRGQPRPAATRLATPQREPFPAKHRDGRSYADVAGQPDDWQVVLTRKGRRQLTNLPQQQQDPPRQQQQTERRQPSPQQHRAPDAQQQPAVQPSAGERAEAMKTLAKRSRLLHSCLREVEEEKTRIQCVSRGAPNRRRSRRLKVLRSREGKLRAQLTDVSLEREAVREASRKSAPEDEVEERPMETQPESPSVASRGLPVQPAEDLNVSGAVCHCLRELQLLCRSLPEPAAALRAVDAVVSALLALVDRQGSQCRA